MAVVPRTTMTRMPEKGVRDLAALHELLDEVQVAHVGMFADGHPLVIPTAMVRDGDRVLIHGSTGSRWMRHLSQGAGACVSVTALDGVVVARSAFESSFHYRSAVLFGRFQALDEASEDTALDVVVDRLIPGRVSELRRPTAREVAATQVLAMPIGEWSLRVSEKWPDDEEDDIAGAAWAGVVPLRTEYGAPEPAPDLRDGIEVPPSVRALAGSGGAQPSDE